MSSRTLVDGTIVEEIDVSSHVITTKCDQKWVLVDNESLRVMTPDPEGSWDWKNASLQQIEQALTTLSKVRNELLEKEKEDKSVPF